MKNNVKHHRKGLKFTQAELANKIDVSRQTINAIEAGKYVPSTVLALKIAKVFNLEVEALFELEAED